MVLQCCSEFNCFANCARAMFVVRIYSNCIWMASSVLKGDWGDAHLLQQDNHLNGVDVVFRFESMTIIETWDKIAGQCDVRGRWLCFKVVYLKLVTLQIHRTAYIFLSDTTRTYNIVYICLYIYIYHIMALFVCCIWFRRPTLSGFYSSPNHHVLKCVHVGG